MRYGHPFRASLGPAVLLTWIVVLFALAGLVGCGESPEPTRVVVSPGPPRDDRVARIAADGERLWLARASVTKGYAMTGVSEYHDANWSELPGPRRSMPNTPLLLIPMKVPGESDRVPCVGDTAPDGKARVRCLHSGRWRSLDTAEVLNGFDLVDMGSVGSAGVALFSKMGINTSMYRLARVNGRRIIPLGNPVKLRGQVLGALGRATTDANERNLIDIGFMGQMSNQRWVATYHPDGGWSHTPILKAKSGSQLSGPVRTADAIIMAVSEINYGKAWPLSAYRYQPSEGWSVVRNKPLADRGQSQGGSYPVGDDAWVIWNQMVFEDVDRAGLAPAKIMAARIGDEERPTKTHTVWKGRILVPTDTQVIEYQGQPAFLYFRQFDAATGTRATVSFVTG